MMVELIESCDALMNDDVREREEKKGLSVSMVHVQCKFCTKLYS